MTLESSIHTHTHPQDKLKHDLLHQKKYVKLLDRWVLVISILSPIMSLPQVWRVWTTQDARGLSLLTWSAWLFFGIFWFMYGLAHREKPIIINNIIWFFIYTSVIVAILLYS